MDLRAPLDGPPGPRRWCTVAIKSCAPQRRWKTRVAQKRYACATFGGTRHVNRSFQDAQSAFPAATFPAFSRTSRPGHVLHSPASTTTDRGIWTIGCGLQVLRIRKPPSLKKWRPRSCCAVRTCRGAIRAAFKCAGTARSPARVCFVHIPAGSSAPARSLPRLLVRYSTRSHRHRLPRQARTRALQSGWRSMADLHARLSSPSAATYSGRRHRSRR